MRMCVVGNGPSARGRGELIDSCDFVVRIKEYWRFGAEDVGHRMDAWAWYGAEAGCIIPRGCQHWITQSLCEFKRREASYQDGWVRLRRITDGNDHMWFINHTTVKELEHYLGAFASTGLRTIAMALQRAPAELVITGFDALADDDPDARGPRRPPCHNMRKEKQLLHELEDGRWLGTPCTTRLIWLGQPE